MKDAVRSTDTLDLAVGGEPVAARWPCPKCGRETTEHAREVAETEPEGTIWRICSAPSCRHEYTSTQRSVLR